MNCTEVRPLLSSYIDGEATPEERVRVEHHISRCEDCHQALAEYRAIGSDIRSLSMPVPPASLRRDVWKAIEVRESGKRAAGNAPGRSRHTQSALPPRVQARPTVASIFTTIGNGWAKALPAALLVGGLLLVMSVLMLRDTIATEAAELVERGPITDYTTPIHVKFNKSVMRADVEKHTYVRRMEGITPYTVTVIPEYKPISSTSGELELRPETSWLPGATYQVYVDCQKIRLDVESSVMQDEPLTFTFEAAAHTPTPTNTSTSTPTPTNTPVPPSSTPESTAVAQESPAPSSTPIVAVRTPTRSVATAVAPRPTADRGSATVPARPTNSVVETATIVPATVVPTRTVPPLLTATATSTATVRPPQSPTAATATATSIRKNTPTVTPSATARVTVTATPPCSIMPVRGFGEVWMADPSVRDRVGCPEAPEGAVTPTAYQRFQGGFMFWRGDTRTVYVFIGGSSDTYGVWRQFPDTWQEGEPLPSKIPPAKLYAPIRGFGKVWYNNESVQIALGWALEPESDTGAVWQEYERGNALWTADRTVRFLYSDGIYARFDDTYSP